jgi:hypothetical protein
VCWRSFLFSQTRAFSPLEPMHKRTSRKAKHGHGTCTFSRSLGEDFEEEEYYAPRRAYRANTGRAGHVEQRTMQEDPYILGGEFSFPMKEDLERREVVGVSSTSPFMTTSASNISQGGAPLQRSPVRERMEECLESDVQPFGQNTWIPSPQPSVPTHHFVHTPQLNTQMLVNVPVSVGAVISRGFATPISIGSMPPLVSISSGVLPLQTAPLNTYTYHANPVMPSQMNNASQTETGGRGTNPPLQHLPKFDGTRKGLGAKTWIADLVESKTLYGLSDSQMIPVARFLCTGQAREWVEIQPDDQTWERFKTAFLREYGEINQDQLLMEMINHFQGEASVGEYATTMQRYFKQIEGISPQRQMGYFVKNLNMGLRESTFVGHPKNLSEAIELARDAENMYISLAGQHNLGKQVSSLQRFV